MHCSECAQSTIFKVKRPKVDVRYLGNNICGKEPKLYIGNPGYAVEPTDLCYYHKKLKEGLFDEGTGGKATGTLIAIGGVEKRVRDSFER